MLRPFLHLITRIIFDEDYRSWSPLLYCPSFSRYRVRLATKYPPQRPILIRLKPMFLLQYEISSFTSIQNKGRNYIFEHFNLHIFGYQTGRQKILHQMIAGIPWVKAAFNFFMKIILICYGCILIFELFHTFRRFITNQSVCCNFVLHNGNETRTYT